MVMVEVLCTNGHRVKVSCNPNSSLRQILEEACNKKGLLPVEDYGLKYNGKVIDLSLPFRFSGLINNSKLEMVVVEKSHISEVIVALQIESGERMQVTVNPSTTLSDVCKKAATLFPMHASHFSGASHPNLTPVVVYFREEIVGSFCLENTSLKTLGLTHGKTVLRFFWRKDAEEQAAEAERALRRKLSSGIPKSHQPSHPEVASSSCPAPTPPYHISGLPAGAANKPEQRPSGACEASFSWFRDPPAPEPVRAQEIVSQFDTNPFNRAEAPLNSQLLNFKFPEETAGQNLYHNEFSDQKEDESLECDRRPVWFAPHIRQLPESTADQLPDSFFDVTEDDLKKMMADLKKRVTDETESPLMTESMRSAAKVAKYAKYRRAVIRFVFPDGIVLQALFHPHEAVHHLYKFMRKKISHSKFILYTTPPKMVLKDSADSLIEANLVPLTRVYIGGDVDANGAVARPNVPLSSEEAAKAVVMECLKNIVAVGQNPPTQRVLSGARKSELTSGSGSSAMQRNKEVPKWFKVGR